MKKELRALSKRAPGALQQAVWEEAQLVLDESNRRINHFRGNLARSGHVVMEGNSVEIVYDAVHALAIHEGLPPGMVFPPPANLREWAEARLGDASLAYPVARGIYEKGIRPRKFLEIAIKERESGMARRIARAVVRGL